MALPHWIAGASIDGPCWLWTLQIIHRPEASNQQDLAWNRIDAGTCKPRRFPAATECLSTALCHRTRTGVLAFTKDDHPF